jgi:hypothetical protein
VAACGHCRCPAEGGPSSLKPKNGLTGPQELADTPSSFLGIPWNPELEPPNAQSIINVPKMHFRCFRGSKNSQKWVFAPKCMLKSTASGTKVPKTTPMKETLLPCTKGLANTGFTFGLDLPHGPQKHRKPPKLGLFNILGFFCQKRHSSRFISSGGVRKCDRFL